MRDINEVRAQAAQAKQNHRPTFPPLNGQAEIDLAIDAAAAAGRYRAIIKKTIPPGIAKQYTDAGFIIYDTDQGTMVFFN